MDVSPDVKPLLDPTHLYSATEILSRPCPMPNSPGVYAWYFDAPLPLIDMAGCHRVDGRALLCVGIRRYLLHRPEISGQAASINKAKKSARSQSKQTTNKQSKRSNKQS